MYGVSSRFFVCPFPSSISPYPRQIAFDRKGRIIYVAAEHSNADLEAAILDAL